MSLRIGSLVLYPDAVFLPFALAFLAVVSYRRLYPRLVSHRAKAVGHIVVAVLGGIAGGWLFGRLGLVQESARVAPQQAAALQFESVGGYWGVLAAVAACAAVIRRPVLGYADAFVPGLTVGGAVARVGCLFAGCCRGIDVGHGWFQPFRPWPLYDMAALLLTGAAVVFSRPKESWSGNDLYTETQRTRRRAGNGYVRFGDMPGLPFCVFLVGYGMLRFVIEFVRQAPAVAAGLTTGQLLALIQTMFGVIVFFAARHAVMSE